MTYMRCTSCGAVLANKVLIYESEMQQACEKIGVDYDMVSLGRTDQNKEYVETRAKIVKKLCKRMCCAQTMITYVDMVHLIKG